MRRTYPLIAGGGPAGSATAISLAAQGSRAVLLERTREPHDLVCGGFMSADTIGLLARVGLSAQELGGHSIGRLRVVAGTRIFETDLPFAAVGLSRSLLDDALLRRAAATGVGVERGVSIRHIDTAARRIQLGDGSTLASNTIMLATGKHDVRGAARPVAAAGNDPPVGFRARLSPSKSLSAALCGTIELHVFKGGYAGFLLIEDGSVNLCLSVAGSRLTPTTRAPAALLAGLAGTNPYLADRLGGAVSAGGWSSIARIPYGWRAEPDQVGVFRLGDQGAVIASLAGDGIGIALASGCMAATAWLKGGAQESRRYQAGFRSRARGPLRLAGGLRWLAEHPLTHGPAMLLMRSSPALARFVAGATRIGDH